MKKLLSHDEMRKQLRDFRDTQQRESDFAKVDEAVSALVDASNMLLSEIAQTLCEEIEKSPASEHLTKCSVLASELRREIETYEQTRPLTPEEKAKVDWAWQRFRASSP